MARDPEQGLGETEQVHVTLLGQAWNDPDHGVGHADPVFLAAAILRRHDESVG